MIGITSYGAYIPRYRMNRKTIFAAMGWFNAATAGAARGEKAVANHDEDSMTMAVAAASDCLNGCTRNEVDGLYLCSTTLPYLERQNAAICAEALAFRQDIRTADFTASLKSGTTGLIAALDAVRSDDTKNFLVCATDARQGKPGSSMEHNLGDGAAALMVGKNNLIAEFKGSFSLTRDFPDYRRIQEERFSHSWEERWIRDEGYMKIIPALVEGLFKKYNLASGDFAKVIISYPGRDLQNVCKRLGFNEEQVQDNLLTNVGDTGSALALMMFVAALEEAKPGDTILLCGYGNGGDALFFEVTDAIEKARNRLGISGHLKIKKELKNYNKYLVFRDMLPLEAGIRGEEITMARMSVINREGQTLAALNGSRCTACNTPQYPKQRVCINPECGAIDQMEDYSFFDKSGRINSFTGDNLAFSWDPPAMYGFIDFEEGGRLYLDITDTELESLRVGMPVRMTFRRKFVDRQRGIYAYFWKAIPVYEANS
ncbi:MAG: OB-fold domain-containing protein [Deltaproteobacteria bacterium]|nr:OB-fold domain-containing protein [Deltaproteobacteria bacterium]